MELGLFGPRGPRRQEEDVTDGGGDGASGGKVASGYYTIPLSLSVDIKDVPEGTTEEQAKELLEADAQEVLEALRVLMGKSITHFRFLNVGPKAIQVGETVSFSDAD